MARAVGKKKTMSSMVLHDKTLHLGRTVRHHEQTRRQAWRTKPFVLCALVCALNAVTHMVRVLPAADLNGGVIWTRAELERCMQTNCVLQAPFNALMTQQEGKQALHAMASFLSEKNNRIAEATPEVLQRARHSICAVVGGAPLGASHSANQQATLIEQAHVIIRLNARYPSFVRAEGASHTLGKRTHVLLLQRGALRHVDRMRYAWAQGNITLSNERRKAFRSFRNEAPTLIYRHECPARFGACASAWRALRRSVLTEMRDVKLVHPTLETHAHALLTRLHPHGAKAVPTTGMIAVLLALRSCATVHVFAMNGSTSTDQHPPSTRARVWRGHNLRAERALLRALHRHAALRLFS